MAPSAAAVDQGPTKHLPKDGIAMTTTLTEERISPLTLLDRCDRCGAQAFYRAIFVTGELTFCGHHGRELLIPLQSTAIFVEDGTELINSKPSPSANAD
jgi:hypothetical protein